MRAALGYPSALANGKINFLQRQLNSARKVLAHGDRKVGGGRGEGGPGGGTVPYSVPYQLSERARVDGPSPSCLPTYGTVHGMVRCCPSTIPHKT